MFPGLAGPFTGSHFSAFRRSDKQQTRNKIPSVLWDADLGLVTVNPRLTNLSFINLALNNAILTRS